MVGMRNVSILLRLLQIVLPGSYAQDGYAHACKAQEHIGNNEHIVTAGEPSPNNINETERLSSSRDKTEASTVV